MFTILKHLNAVDKDLFDTGRVLVRVVEGRMIGDRTRVKHNDVGEEALLVHNETRDHPSVAFALSRLAPAIDEPIPMGVFRAVEKDVYGEGNPVPATPPGREQIDQLLHSGSTWEVT